MNNPIDKINQISNLESFLDFMRQLASDAKDHSEEWEIGTISEYLEQMAAWIEDYSEVDKETDWNEIDFKTIAKILYMGKIYE